jgi:DNA repair exonuclease SbcCD ATPase subunit
MPEMDAVGKFVHSKTVSLSESITSLSTKIEMLDKSILDKQRDLDSVRKMEQDFADKRAEEIKLRKLQISASLEKLSNSRTGYLKSIKINEAEVERLISLISKANTKKDSEAETISKLESAHSDNEATVKMNKVMLRKYTDMKATSICPECNQAVGRDHIKNLVSLTDRAYNASKAQAAESLKALTSAKASHQKTQEHLFDILTRKTNLRQVIGSTLMHVNNCENSIRSLKEELAQLTEEDTVNPFKELVHSTKQELSKLKAELEDRQHSITVKERTKQYYDFWKRGFGPDGMRAYLLDAVTPDLNKLANIYLQELTDGTVSVELSTVSAKKDGTFADRFSVTIDNSIGSRYFAGNSDGEIACVDLAINFAMSDILESRLKDGFGLLYIDQAIDNVDPVRGEKALTLLSRRVDKKWCHNIGLPPKDHVFVITHREQFKDRLESTIFVEKENGICRRID